MLNRNSIYALNQKDPQAIVYTDAMGNLIRLTQADFASSDEYQHWKAMSDEDYHCSEKRNHVYSDHTVALDALAEIVASVPSAEAVIEQADVEQEYSKSCIAAIEQIKSCLTDVQFRRLWMSAVEGRTVREIGQIDGTSFQSVAKSILASKKKIYRLYAKQCDKAGENPHKVKGT